MKKIFITVAALGLLIACNGKQASGNTPVEMEEEDIEVTTVPNQSNSSTMSTMKEKPAKPVNMRDSLKVDPNKGAVIQKRYKGTVPAADGPGIVYDLTIYYQEETPEGVFELDQTYLDADNGEDKTFSTTGKQKRKKGSAADASALVYELIPSDGDASLYFEVQGDSLIMLNDALEQAASGLDYILTAVK